MVVTNYSGWQDGYFMNPAGPSTFYLSLPMPNTATAVAGDISISQDSNEGADNTMCITTLFFYINFIDWANGIAVAGYNYDCRYNFDQGLGAFPQNNGANSSIALYVKFKFIPFFVRL